MTPETACVLESQLLRDLFICFFFVYKIGYTDVRELKILMVAVAQVHDGSNILNMIL